MKISVYNFYTLGPMTFPEAEVLEITNEGIKSIIAKETEHFFYNKKIYGCPREQMIDNLLNEIILIRFFCEEQYNIW